MKTRYYYILLIMATIMVSSCKKDNYAAPEVDFTGRLVYKGEAVNVQYDNVNFELWQPGFGKNGAITVTIAQDGGYSAKLFNGNYKLVFVANQGPFLWPKNTSGAQDTIAVSLSGNKVMDIEVVPYYMIRNAAFTVSGRTVTASCNLEKIITDGNAKDIERVVLYVNRTQFVDGNNKIANQDLTGTALTNLASLNFSLTVPAITPAQSYVFARIGVKISGVEDMIFTPVSKLTF